LESPVTESADQPKQDADSRKGGWSRMLVDLRLARRQTTRAWGSSLLVIVLVAMPMALLSGAATFAFSRLATPDQKVTSELGQADAWLQTADGPDPSRWQDPADPWNTTVERDSDNVPINPELAPIDDVTPLLPPGTRAIEIADTSVTAETPGGIGLFALTIGDAWDPTLDGRFESIAGRTPANDGEAMVSPGAAERLDAQIGDTLILTEPRTALTIVGILKASTQPDATQTIFVPGRATLGESEVMHTWFTPDWQPTAEDLPALNHEGVIVYARDLVTTATGAGSLDPGAAWAIGAATAIIATFCAYLVVLLAGAAFAVSARRQQRSLAVAASVGAPRSSVFRIVLFQGTVLGVVGGMVGAAVGIGLAAITLAVLDDGSAQSFWGFNVPLPLVVGIVLFAIAVGTASALLPARAATRGDVLAALRGARRPVSVRADRPLWGSLLVAVGLALTVAAGLTLGALNAAEVV
jgi:putative ABC transport system permease protein